MLQSSPPAGWLASAAARCMRVATDGEGRMRPDALEWALSATSGPRHRLRAGRQRQHRRLRSAGRDCRAHARPRGVAARRRRLRAVGERVAALPPSRRRRRRGGFLDDRRAQVAQRAVRQRHRHRASSGRTSRGDEPVGGLPHPGKGEQRDGMDWAPEASRRARVVPIHLVLRTLGRAGVAALVERCCAPGGADGLPAAANAPASKCSTTSR